MGPAVTDPPWLARVERRVRRWLSRGLGPAWLVAVSGGSDSVGLLRALHGMDPRLGLVLSVAHLDHGVRGEAGRADAVFVAELAQELGLPFDLGQWSPVRPGHFEGDARRARLAFLHSAARAGGAAAVALGHTRDDQAETVLHRVVRGTGPRGLAGIPWRRSLGDGVVLARPLLDVSRQELRTFLADLGQPFRDDATNADTTHTRARIRHELLPRLEADFNPRVADALARLARLAGASYRVQRLRAGQLVRAATLTRTDDTVVFDREQLLAAPAVVRAEAIRLAWRRLGWAEGGMNAARWRRLVRLATGDRSGAIDVGAGVVARVEGPRLTLQYRGGVSSQPGPAAPAEVPLTIPGAAFWPGGQVVLVVDPQEPCDEKIDLSRLSPPLCLRAPRPGDRFDPLGMGGRMQILNDFFRGRRIPPDARARTPLLCDASGIVWVVGHRIADRVGLTESTVRTAGLRWESV